jgi:hypothetical protein
MQNDPSSINAETQEQIEAEEHPLPTPVFRHVARVVLASFVLTFIASRVMVILIMDQKVPDFYFHVGKTHVHHLNYGIFTLSGVGAYLLFRRPSGSRLTWATIVYGIGLGLTFDEFGMWIHLGGSYWQRASFDAVVMIASALGLIAYAPSLSRFRTAHWVWTLVLSVAVIGAIVLLGLSVTRVADRWAPWLQSIETSGPQ